VVNCLETGAFEAIHRWLTRRFDPAPYPSFDLVAAHPRAAYRFTWNGAGDWAQQSLPAGWSLVSSSAWRTAEVLRWRKGAFDKWLKDGAPLSEAGIPALNLVRPEREERYAPLMSRPESATRSITRVDVSGTLARLWYWPVEDGSLPDTPVYAELTLTQSVTR